MMGFDPSKFTQINIADTCSIWNLLASKVFYERACAAKCYFSCTRFVLYECLHKPRKTELTSAEIELRNRLEEARKNGSFSECHLDIQDLQEVSLLQKRKNLSMGEIASIALAKKINQSFLTDDDKAMKLAIQILGREMVQTTPHLLGWLFFYNYLSDHELSPIIQDFEDHQRYISQRLNEAYKTTLSYRATANISFEG